MRSSYRLSISKEAQADLASIREWLLQPGSGRRSHGRYSAVLQAVDDLRTGSGRWPFGNIVGVRERPVTGHRIYYRIDEERKRIRILRIFGPFQDRSRL